MPAGSNFNTTRWQLVASSRDENSQIRRESLGELCNAYWYPLFAYLRRKGNSTEEASDIVQGFFLELIDKDFLAAVSPDRGRFRWFLMSAVSRFASKEFEKQTAQKRGGGANVFSLDFDSAEERYQREPIDGWTAEKLFDRRWALEVLSQALARLRSEHDAKGKLALYESLQPTLGGQSLSAEDCETIGQRLDLSPVAVKVAAHRLKKKYRDALVDIVSQTLDDPSSVDNELETLLQALAG